MPNYIIRPVIADIYSTKYYHYIAYEEDLLSGLPETLTEQAISCINSLIDVRYHVGGTRLKKIRGFGEVRTARVNDNDRLTITYIKYKAHVDITVAYIHELLTGSASHKLEENINLQKIDRDQESFKTHISEFSGNLFSDFIDNSLSIEEDMLDGIVYDSTIIEFTERQREGLNELLKTPRVGLQIGWQGTGKTVLLQTAMLERLEQHGSCYRHGYIVSREESLIPVLQGQLSKYAVSEDIELRALGYVDFIKDCFLEDVNDNQFIGIEGFSVWYDRYIDKINNQQKSRSRETNIIFSKKEDYKKKVYQVFSLFAGQEPEVIANHMTGFSVEETGFIREMYDAYIGYIEANNLIDLEQFSPNMSSVNRFAMRCKNQGGFILGLEESQNLNARMWLNMIFVLCAQQDYVLSEIAKVKTIQQLKSIVQNNKELGYFLEKLPLLINYDPAQKIKTSGILLPTIKAILNPITSFYTENHRSPLHIQRFCLPLTDTVKKLMLKTKTTEGVDTKLGVAEQISLLKEDSASATQQVFLTKKEVMIRDLKFDSGRWLVIAHKSDKKKYEKLLNYPVLSSEDVLSLESDYVLVINPWNFPIFKTIAKRLEHSTSWYESLNESEKNDALHAYKILAIMFGRARKQLFIYQENCNDKLLETYLQNSTDELPELDNSLLKPEALREKILRFIENNKEEEGRKFYNATNAWLHLQQTFEEIAALRHSIVQKSVETKYLLETKNHKKKKKKLKSNQIENIHENLDNSLSSHLIEKEDFQYQVMNKNEPLSKPAAFGELQEEISCGTEQNKSRLFSKEPEIDVKSKEVTNKDSCYSFRPNLENNQEIKPNFSLGISSKNSTTFEELRNLANHLLENFDFINLKKIFQNKTNHMMIFETKNLVENNNSELSSDKVCFLEYILRDERTRQIFIKYLKSNKSDLKTLIYSFNVFDYSSEPLDSIFVRLGLFELCKLVKNTNISLFKAYNDTVLITGLWNHSQTTLYQFPEIFEEYLLEEWYYSSEHKKRQTRDMPHYPNEIIKFLLKSQIFLKSSVKDFFDNLLNDAVSTGSNESLNEVVFGSDIYPLHILAAMNQYDLIIKFLQKGANPNVKMRDGVTPALIACILDNDKILRVLLKFSANIHELVNSNSLMDFYLQFNIYYSPSSRVKNEKSSQSNKANTDSVCNFSIEGYKKEPEEVSLMLLYHGANIHNKNSHIKYLKNELPRLDLYLKNIIIMRLILSGNNENIKNQICNYWKIDEDSSFLYQRIFTSDLEAPKMFLEHLFANPRFFENIFEDCNPISNAIFTYTYKNQKKYLYSKILKPNILYFAFKYDRVKFIIQFLLFKLDNSVSLKQIFEEVDHKKLTPVHYGIFYNAEESLKILFRCVKFSYEFLENLLSYANSIKIEIEKTSISLPVKLLNIISILEETFDKIIESNKYLSVQKLFLSESDNTDCDEIEPEEYNFDVAKMLEETLGNNIEGNKYLSRHRLFSNHIDNKERNEVDSVKYQLK